MDTNVTRRVCRECAQGQTVLRRIDDARAVMSCGHQDGNAYVVAVVSRDTITRAGDMRPGDVIDVCHGYRRTVTRIEPRVSGGLRVWFAENFDQTRPAIYDTWEPVTPWGDASPA